MHGRSKSDHISVSEGLAYHAQAYTVQFLWIHAFSWPEAAVTHYPAHQSALFFCLLALAALTSTISLMEVVTVYLFEEYKISRRKSTIFVTLGVIILGIISSYSSVFFNILDMASAKYMLPIGGLFISIFVGWYLKQQLVTAQITNEGKLRFGVGFIKFYIFLLRFIAPIAILSIFVYGLTG
jgi:NSS family neurotransmitter:Na+ symporter